jgi:hypothetical protein
MDESDFGMLKSVAQHSALLRMAEGKSHQDGASCDTKASRLVSVFVLRYGTTSFSQNPVTCGSWGCSRDGFLLRSDLVQWRYIKVLAGFACSLWFGIGV